MSSAERGRDRAHLDLQHVCDRAVVQVGPVTKEDGHPLTLRERPHPHGHVRRPIPFADASSGATEVPDSSLAARMPAVLAVLTTIRRTHASSGHSPRNASRCSIARANPSCTASLPASTLPAIEIATRANAGHRSF
jgi:hypothetical protein